MGSLKTLDATFSCVSNALILYKYVELADDNAVGTSQAATNCSNSPLIPPFNFTPTITIIITLMLSETQAYSDTRQAVVTEFSANTFN